MTDASLPQPRLEIRNLQCSFAGRRVVDDVSLSVMPGQVTCLLGPSGCGKSTTLRMIAGIETQDAGSIWADGNLLCDATTRVPPEGRGIGLMFQDFALFPHLTGAEDVALGPRARPDRAAMAAEYLKKVDLDGFGDKYPHQLSGGEQQRVALARAVINSPAIILADEPTGNLDTENSDIVLDMFKELNERYQQTIIMITHNPEAARHCGRVINMRDGVIVDE